MPVAFVRVLTLASNLRSEFSFHEQNLLPRCLLRPAQRAKDAEQHQGAGEQQGGMETLKEMGL